MPSPIAASEEPVAGRVGPPGGTRPPPALATLSTVVVTCSRAVTRPFCTVRVWIVMGPSGKASESNPN